MHTYERASDILLIAHVGTIGDGSGMCYDTSRMTVEGRTCDDIRDVLGLPRDPSGDNKRTTRTGTYQWTTSYCVEIALARLLANLPTRSFSIFLLDPHENVALPVQKRSYVGAFFFLDFAPAKAYKFLDCETRMV